MSYFDEINKVTNVSRETFSKLEQFCSELLKWNKSINLISKSHSAVSDVWERHILDSAQLIKYIPEGAKTITDFGSGGGLPAVVLAIIGDYEVHLIESDQRKCAFMTQMGALLNINVRVHNERIEKIEAWKSDVLTSRALASVDKLLDLTKTFVKKSDICLFLKGQNVVQEIEEASIYWEFSHKLYPSITDKTGNILELHQIRHK